MTVSVDRWTTSGPVVSTKIKTRDSSGIGVTSRSLIVHGKKSWKKLAESPGEPDSLTLGVDGSDYVALKGGHAYRITAGDAVIETDKLDADTVLLAPGPDASVEPSLPDQASE